MKLSVTIKPISAEEGWLPFHHGNISIQLVDVMLLLLQLSTFTENSCTEVPYARKLFLGMDWVTASSFHFRHIEIELKVWFHCSMPSIYVVRSEFLVFSRPINHLIFGGPSSLLSISVFLFCFEMNAVTNTDQTNSKSIFILLLQSRAPYTNTTITNIDF